MNEQQQASAAIIGDLVGRAIPINPTPLDYVTRSEFTDKISLVESKIERETLKTKLWILTGVIAIVMAFGGGVYTILTRIDRISESLPEIAKVQDGRRDWILRKDQQDMMQDEALRRLAPAYEPLPMQVPPK